MKKVKIKDGSFPQSNSATLAGDNDDLGSRYFEWLREDSPGGTVWFTDICLTTVLNYKADKRIAWLLEPPEINPNSYFFCEENEGLFDYILTYDKEHVELSDKWLFYPFGGSWIRPESQRIWSKNKLVSMIASEKELTYGHKLRHQIVEEFAGSIDVMGRGYAPIPSKRQGLIPYRYSIVVENAKRDWWFTEKLVDCFSVGTVPIYWGTEDLDKWFDTDGMIFFDTLTDLRKILTGIDQIDYLQRMKSIEANFVLAQDYFCVEDWIYINYPFLFE